METFRDDHTIGISLLCVAVVAWAWYRKLPWSVSPGKGEAADSDAAEYGPAADDFVEIMNQKKKQCIVFYGTETGTAEAYAKKLAPEVQARFRLMTMVADLDDYNMEHLVKVPSTSLVIFILATSGDGEATSNADEFYNMIVDVEGEPLDLPNLRFAAFGLGNHTYEHYNEVVRRVSSALTDRGAHMVGPRGEGDDGAGTMEEDFSAWKTSLWSGIVKDMDLKEEDFEYIPAYTIVEHTNRTCQSPDVYLGELSPSLMRSTAPAAPASRTNPHLGQITLTRELFKSLERNCLHMEIDVSGSGQTYHTGDHIGVWPSNADVHVDAVLRVLGLIDKRNCVVSIQGSMEAPIPTPTTYDAIVRHYLEICGPISRESLALVASFAPNETAKSNVTALCKTQEVFNSRVKDKCVDLATILYEANDGQPWAKLPLAVLLEVVPRLAPRLYSISSASLETPTTVSITASVESRAIPGCPKRFHGVATNYLLALHNSTHPTASNGNQNSAGTMSYDVKGPRGILTGPRVPCYLQSSSFRLPTDTTKPIIMVGPGSGVAPFRGFIRHYATLARQGKPIGKMLLFFGCRHRDEDYIYEEEWLELQSFIGDSLEVILAPSREGAKKVYVQHRLMESAAAVDSLLQQGAHLYVCGDAARMAWDVNAAFLEILVRQRGMSVETARDHLKQMKSSKQYQEDVW